MSRQPQAHTLQSSIEAKGTKAKGEARIRLFNGSVWC